MEKNKLKARGASYITTAHTHNDNVAYYIRNVEDQKTSKAKGHMYITSGHNGNVAYYIRNVEDQKLFTNAKS